MIGMDRGLRSTSQQPLRQQPSAPMRQTPAAARPPGISDAAVQGAVNNQLASGYGAGRMALSNQDRAGVSRGRGQQYYANVAQEGADVEGAANATKTMADASAANQNAAWQYDTAMRNEQLANQGLLEGLRNSQAMAQLANQQRGQQLYEAYRNGQFGLDQQQLDYTPLLQGLFN